MKRTVGSLLEDRDRTVWSIAPTATVFDALTRLSEHRIGAIVVIDDGRLVGIFSERDYARKVILNDRSSHETTVGEIMTPNPFTAAVDQSIEDCLQLMNDGEFRHLPVMDNGELVGVVSLLDVTRAVVQNQASLILDLERYITG